MRSGGLDDIVREYDQDSIREFLSGRDFGRAIEAYGVLNFVESAQHASWRSCARARRRICRHAEIVGAWTPAERFYNELQESSASGRSDAIDRARTRSRSTTNEIRTLFGYRRHASARFRFGLQTSRPSSRSHARSSAHPPTQLLGVDQDSVPVRRRRWKSSTASSAAPPSPILRSGA